MFYSYEIMLDLLSSFFDGCGNSDDVILERSINSLGKPTQSGSLNFPTGFCPYQSEKLNFPIGWDKIVPRKYKILINRGTF